MVKNGDKYFRKFSDTKIKMMSHAFIWSNLKTWNYKFVKMERGFDSNNDGVQKGAILVSGTSMRVMVGQPGGVERQSPLCQ